MLKKLPIMSIYYNHLCYNYYMYFIIKYNWHNIFVKLSMKTLFTTI